MDNESKELDVVLSGAGVRIGAFVGALRAIEEAGHRVVRIAATSGGSIVAAMYASGLPLDQLQEMMYDLDYKEMRRFSITSLLNMGLFSQKGIEDYINKHTNQMTFSQASIECHFLATDMHNGDSVIFNPQAYPNMTLGEAASISSSIPGFYGQKVYEGKVLADGSLSNNYPIELFENNIRPTIGFLIRGEKDKDRNPRFFFDYVAALSNIIMNRIESIHIKETDWRRTIILNVGQVPVVDFSLNRSQKKKLFDIGYQSTKDNLQAALDRRCNY